MKILDIATAASCVAAILFNVGSGDWFTAMWAAIALAWFILYRVERDRVRSHVHVTLVVPEGIDEREVANRLMDYLRTRQGGAS